MLDRLARLEGMNWKLTLATLTAVAGPAFADPPCDDEHAARPVAYAPPAPPAQYAPPPQYAPPVPPPVPGGQVQPGQRPGRWELRDTQQWIAGTTETVWVDGRCHGHGWRARCEPGRYVTRTTPGRYVTVQQWVWVEVQRHERWARRGHRF